MSDIWNRRKEERLKRASILQPLFHKNQFQMKDKREKVDKHLSSSIPLPCKSTSWVQRTRASSNSNKSEGRKKRRSTLCHKTYHLQQEPRALVLVPGLLHVSNPQNFATGHHERHTHSAANRGGQTSWLTYLYWLWEKASLYKLAILVTVYQEKKEINIKQNETIGGKSKARQYSTGTSILVGVCQ